MDIGSVAGSALLTRSGQTQQALSTSMMKQAATQQNQVADMLARNIQNVPQSGGASSGGGTGFNFSVYA